MSASKDVVFEIEARKRIATSEKIVWLVKVKHSGVLYFTDSEYAAFRSLLVPNSHADFILKEFDENGNLL